MAALSGGEASPTTTSRAFGVRMCRTTSIASVVPLNHSSRFAATSTTSRESRGSPRDRRATSRGTRVSGSARNGRAGGTRWIGTPPELAGLRRQGREVVRGADDRGRAREQRQEAASCGLHAGVVAEDRPVRPEDGRRPLRRDDAVKVDVEAGEEGPLVVERPHRRDAPGQPLEGPERDPAPGGPIEDVEVDHIDVAWPDAGQPQDRPDVSEVEVTPQGIGQPVEQRLEAESDPMHVGKILRPPGSHQCGDVHAHLLEGSHQVPHGAPPAATFGGGRDEQGSPQRSGSGRWIQDGRGRGRRRRIGLTGQARGSRARWHRSDARRRR